VRRQGTIGLVHALLFLIPVAACAGEAPKGNSEIGRRLFTKVAQPPCSTCHALKDAGASGTIGPSLDELRPDTARVKAAVRDGVGVMPAYREQLTAEQIGALAAYVPMAAAGKGP
jgi:mono/diheme cytochrome c family protein